jgi:sugar-specific transcriptional regulator TrmB
MLRDLPVDLGPVVRSDLLVEILHLVLVERGEWTADQLASRTGAPYPTVTKEVRRLERSGLVTTTVIGRTKLLRADSSDSATRAFARAVALARRPEGGDMAKKKDKKKKGKKKK